jgi:1-deoxy-D-xylulose 5-phosphate reductoisomerase
MKFLEKQLAFLDIPVVVEQTMDAIPRQDLNSLDDVYSIDREARDIALEQASLRA